MRGSILESLLVQATGETRSTLRRRGFHLADPLDVDFDPEPDLVPPQVFDWDTHAACSLTRIV